MHISVRRSPFFCWERRMVLDLNWILGSISINLLNYDIITIKCYNICNHQNNNNSRVITNKDSVKDLSVTQYFESARQTSLIATVPPLVKVASAFHLPICTPSIERNLHHSLPTMRKVDISISESLNFWLTMRKNCVPLFLCSTKFWSKSEEWGTFKKEKEKKHFLRTQPENYFWVFINWIKIMTFRCC